VSEVLFWALSCVLFLVAVACAVFGALVRGDERRYLVLSAWAAWVVLCLALGLVMSAGLL
jgi:Na+-transporting NADH:ubiquinone oxidoreductase subunit NqrE